MDGLSLSNARPALPLEPKVESPTGPSKGSGASFSDTLKDAIHSVNDLQKDADTKVQNLATGKSQNLHETMIATEKADIALRLMVQVRNKIIDAYQEVMKMQV
ncbi:MAG: flagellar hook-basal body complex protein FliE [Bdellovibrionales bacterium]|nr:flagellar hook-basal body complex protein FliE [Bdellovibrionales bacterium]